MGVTAGQNQVVRTDRSLSEFMDRYERFVMGEITYDQLHSGPRDRLQSRLARFLSRPGRRSVAKVERGNGSTTR